MTSGFLLGVWHVCLFPFFPIQGLKTHYNLRPRVLQCPTCSCTMVPPSLGSCFSEKGLGPTPSGLWWLSHSPTPPRTSSSLAEASEGVLTTTLDIAPPTFSRGIPHDEALYALAIWSWTKGLRMQMIRGASGLPDLPARESLQGFQVQHTRVGW